MHQPKVQGQKIRSLMLVSASKLLGFVTNAIFNQTCRPMTTTLNGSMQGYICSTFKSNKPESLSMHRGIGRILLAGYGTRVCVRVYVK